jgi:hypothetical protein
MLSETIDVAASLPASIRYLENGDPLNTGNFKASAEDIAAALGYVVRRLPSLGGVLTTNGAGGVTIDASTGGFTAAISGSFVRITFSAALASANYAVIVTGDNDVNGFWGNYDARTTAKVDLSLWSATGTQMNLGAASASFSFVLYTF